VIHNIEASQVELDRAESRGLVGYPDVLGKLVTVRVPTSGSGSRLGPAQRGTVTGLSPIGFMLRCDSPEYVFRNANGHEVKNYVPMFDERTPFALDTTFQFYPWSLVVIELVVRAALDVPPPVRDVVNNDADAEASVLESFEVDRHTGVVTPESIVGAGEITQAMLDIATGDELDALGRELGIFRGVWPNGDPEMDVSYRAQLVARARRRGA
jgi:hypothetical protein